MPHNFRWSGRAGSLAPLIYRSAGPPLTKTLASSQLNTFRKP